MKIIGFPVDVSRSQDGRVVRGLRTRHALIQATLDLIQAGDVEPTSAAIATIAGVSSRALFQHFTSLAELYAAAFDLAVSRAFDRTRPIESGASLSSRIDLLVSDRSAAVRGMAPGMALCRARALRRSGGRPRRLAIAQAAARASRGLVRDRTRRSRAGVARSRARFARSCIRARQLDEHARAASTVAGPCVADLALYGGGDRPCRRSPCRNGPSWPATA